MMSKKKKFWLILVSMVLIIALVNGIVLLREHEVLQVTIRNTGDAPLRSVVLHVTGRSYELGDIAPGTSAEEMVNPTGESHLDVEFSDGNGRTKRLKADVYFEPGYWGTISVSIKDGAIEGYEQDVWVYSI